ncbi:hypothetical protein B0H14DRAFT_2603720 [Mycena olivaceomarginata]|nr:hypothetical protein B0H14DRAFT_2603720 [Mycena olivaceomarginata]
MAPKTWETTEQQKWLQGRLAEFLKRQAEGKLHLFWPPMQEAWFKAFTVHTRLELPLPNTKDARVLENSESSPAAPAPTQKRNHGTMAGDNDDSNSDNEQRNRTAPAPILANHNLVAATKLYADKKRLRVEQATELELFVNLIRNKEPAPLREVKLLANLFAFGNELGKLVASKPGFEVSSDLNTNIVKYAPAVLLSSKITIYKGNGTTNILLAILKQYRFDMPAGLENIPTDWEKVVEAVQDALTQRRSKIKKSIRASLKPNKDGGYAPKEDHLNIFDLTQNIVKGTQCAVNVVLCARIALMRKVYRKHPGVKFWDELDKRLAKIRAEAKGDMKQVTRAFRHILTEDQDTHGAKTYELDENTGDTFQEGVDTLIEAGAKDALGMRDDA